MAKTSTVDRLFDELLTSIHDAKDFAVEQAPEIAKQMVAEEIAVKQVEIVSASIVLIASLLAILFCIFGPEVKSWATFEAGGFLPIAKLLLGVGSFLGILFSTSVLYDSFMALMKLRVAPKVFLLKKLSKLARG